MSSGSLTTTPRRTRIRWGLVLAGLCVTTVAAAVYAVLGWQRMDAACLADDAVPAGATTARVELSWSWDPPGFTCAWASETGIEPITQRSLWWD